MELLPLVLVLVPLVLVLSSIVSTCHRMGLSLYKLLHGVHAHYKSVMVMIIGYCYSMVHSMLSMLLQIRGLPVLSLVFTSYSVTFISRNII